MTETIYESYYHRCCIEIDGDIQVALTEALLREEIGSKKFDPKKAAGNLFWSVYGVEPEGLSMWVHDFRDERAAASYAATLNSIVAAKAEPMAEPAERLVEDAVIKGDVAPDQKRDLNIYYTAYKQTAERKYGYGEMADEEFDSVVSSFKELTDEQKAVPGGLIRAAFAEVKRIAEKYDYTETSTGFRMR